MPAYKDIDKKTGKTKSWFCKFQYSAYTGERKTKLKRGFPTRAAALQWERDFIERAAGSPSITLANLARLYLDDITQRRKPNTIRHIEHALKLYILPALGKIPINEITPATVRKWQNDLTAHKPPYAPTTLHEINARFSALLSYAVKMYGLPFNPVARAGGIGSLKSGRMSFWTTSQFAAFLLTEHKPQYIALYTLLFWAGLRLGEVLALTPADFSEKFHALTVSKSHSRINKQDIITTPKTSQSCRTISLPPFLSLIVKDYIMRAGIAPGGRLFECVNRTAIRREFISHTKKADLPCIRIHDLRHSHASLLISLGVPPVEVMERLGHSNIQTTINTYSHLYPHKKKGLAEILQQAPIL